MKTISNNVLLIDENVSNYIHVQNILSKYNVNVYYSNNKGDAIETFKENGDIDLAIIDLSNKTINGFELSFYFKSLRKGFPVIFKTVHAKEFSNDEFLVGVGDGYIDNDLKSDKILKELNRFLFVEKIKLTEYLGRKLHLFKSIMSSLNL